MAKGFTRLTATGVGLLLLCHAACGQEPETKAPLAGSGRLIEVATSDRQWTGVAVSAARRVFVNYPRWSPSFEPPSVGELKANGSVVAYPSSEQNDWKIGDSPTDRFVCVQSVHVDSKDRLWILDSANPMFQGVVKGGAKLMQVDLTENQVARTIHFDDSIAPPASYLNDVRVDTDSETAFITDSGLGAILVVDLPSGEARRVLGEHPSTKAEATTITIAGRAISAVVHSDGIALDQDGGWLYYQALTGRTLYRVPVAALRDETLTPDQLASRIEVFAHSGVSDGLLFGPGGIYVSSIEDDSIKLVDAGGSVTTLARDKRIAWPDSFALAPGGEVWFTTSQIHLGPNPPTPYRILKVAVAAR